MFDFLNAVCIALLILWVSKAYKLSSNISILLFFHLIAIFLLNDVMFPKEYFGDQLRYLDVAKATREAFAFFPTDEMSLTVSIPGTFFALYPIPFISSVYSIAMINFTLFLFLFIFLKQRGVLSGKLVYFYLLYPSLMLYSSLALRDTLIFLLMALSIYWAFIRHSILIPILLALPLLLIKPQNFFILLVSYAIFFSFSKSWKIKLFAWLCFAGIVSFLSDYVTIEAVNELKLAFFMEDGGDPFDYNYLGSWGDIILSGSEGIIAILLRPYPWEVRNPMQLLQSIENIVVFWIIIKVIIVNRKILANDKFALFLNVFLFSGLAIYSIIVSNFGTVARYKFPFIAIYLIFYFYIVQKYKINNTLEKVA